MQKKLEEKNAKMKETLHRDSKCTSRNTLGFPMCTPGSNGQQGAAHLSANFASSVAIPSLSHDLTNSAVLTSQLPFTSKYAHASNTESNRVLTSIRIFSAAAAAFDLGERF